MKRRSLLGGSASVAFALVVASCLPGDDRPIPGSVLVTAEPSAETAAGFTTADGWTVSFDRFITALGDVDLDSEEDGDEESCTDYSETRYEWLFDFTEVTQEKVGIVYGLGTCSLEYRLRGPSEDTVVGKGATEEDADAMRVRGSDLYAENERASVRAIGRATKDGLTKRFDWTFRHTFDIEKCASADGQSSASLIALVGGVDVTMRVVVRGEELFRSAGVDDADLAFAPFEQADMDGDGTITLDELALAPAPPGSDRVDEDVERDEDDPFVPPETLADLVYEVNLLRVSRLADGGPCRTNLRRRFGPPN